VVRAAKPWRAGGLRCQAMAGWWSALASHGGLVGSVVLFACSRE
jgi:hypothetical protein